MDEGCHGPKLVCLVLRTTGEPVPLRTLQRFVAEELRLTMGELTEIGTGMKPQPHAVLCTAGHRRQQFL